jgi:hypothetical protein
MSLLGNFLIQRALRRAAFEALVDRRRSRADPARGRFTRANVSEMLPVVWRFAGTPAAAPTGETGRVATSLQLARFARAFLDALILREVERGYAIELVADLMWRLERHWAELGALAMLAEPRWPRVRDTVPRPPPFAFCPAASTTAPRGVAGSGDYTVTCCPAAGYLRAHQAADLCRAVFCDAVHPIGERAGLRLERTHTIADGAAACDVHWARA